MKEWAFLRDALSGSCGERFEQCVSLSLSLTSPADEEPALLAHIVQGNVESTDAIRRYKENGPCVGLAFRNVSIVDVPDFALCQEFERKVCACDCEVLVRHCLVYEQVKDGTGSIRPS